MAIPAFAPAPHHALPDVDDERDQYFMPATTILTEQVDLACFLKFKLPVLDQGHENACTGFALATVVHYLQARHQRPAELSPVSPQMLYEMAKRYDGNTDPNHQGSTARAAMKAWHRHGVCGDELWPFCENDSDLVLTPARALDALRRPLGAYSRVCLGNLFDMRAAVVERGAVYATTRVHDGWHQVGPDGIIPFPGEHIGAHALAVIGYDRQGFWFQNSKSRDWGNGGLGCITFDDWTCNAQDAWVADLPANDGKLTFLQ